MKKILVAILLVTMMVLSISACDFFKPEVKTYTVTFDVDGGSAVAAQTVNEGEAAVKPADPTKEGFTFVGWYVGDAEYDFATPVTADVTVKAKWEENTPPAPETFTVTFDTDGGSAVAAQTVEDGAKAEKPADPTKAGYNFVGWYVGDAEYDFEAPVTADVALKAVWSQNKYTVTFNTDGGSAVEAQTVVEGAKAEKPADPTKEDYDFAGWYVGENAYDFEAPVTADVEITAKWTAKAKYTVTFDVDGGSAVEAQTVVDGKVAVKPADPTKTGFAFAGWYLGENEYDFTAPVTGDIIVKAKWNLDLPDLTAIAGKYTGDETIGVYATNSYEFIINADGTITASYENSYTTVAMVINYVLFDGATLTINYTASSTTADMVFTYADGKLTTDSAVAGMPLTLAKTYTVTFDSNGANKDKEYTVAHGDLVTKYEPTRTGYDLEGWYLNGVAFDITKTPITSDIILVAEWKVKMIKVTFVGQDGKTPVAEMEVAYNTTYGELVTPTTIPTTDGYKFNGIWYGTATSTIPVSSTAKITAEKTYYPGLIGPMEDIAGTWKGTDNKGTAFTVVIDAAEQTVAITTVAGDTVTEYNVTSVYYKDTTKFVVRYLNEGATSETSITFTAQDDGTFKGNSNALVIAKEGQKTYTVTFDSAEGTAVESQTIVDGEKAEKPADPTKDGFTFAGWYLGENEYDFTTPVTGDIILVAKWEEKVTVETYTVTFMKDTTVFATQTIEKGQCAEKPATNPTAPSNYTFAYWEYKGAEFDFNTPITGDITLVAKIKGKDVTLAFYYDRTDCGSDSTKFVEVIVEYGKPVDTSLVPYDKIVMAEGEIFNGVWHKGSGNTAAPFDFSADISSTSKQKLYPGAVAASITDLEGTWSGTVDAANSSSTYVEGSVYAVTIDVDESNNVTVTVTVDGTDLGSIFSSAQFDGTRIVYKYFKSGSSSATTINIDYNSETQALAIYVSSSKSISLTKQ